MKLKLIVTAMIAGGLIASAWAKGPVRHDNREFKREMAAAKQEAAPPPADTTGDADSFGRNVKFIGLMASGVITLATDCTPDPNFPPDVEDHCFVLNAQPAVTSFSIADAARMVIPAKSSNSMFCHWQTPVAIYAYNNATGSYMPNARILATPSYKFQNAVLNDPSLIDPNTGLPFNGSFTVSLAGIRHARGLQPGDYQVERDTETRSCIGGLVSKRALKEAYGLTDAQATNFFKNDTAITMSISGNVQGMDFASIIYGTRFVGD